MSDTKSDARQSHHLRRHHRALLVHALHARLGRAVLRVIGQPGAAMTRPWQRPPEDQIVAVVHALQELLVGVTELSMPRAVLGGAQGRRGRCWSPTGPGGIA